MPGQIDYSKLRILPDPDTKEWWEGTKQRKYLVRQCKSCGHKFFPPLPACAKCTSMDLGWFETVGRGMIHSYCVVTQPILGAFIPAAPYVVAVIELEDCREADGSVTRVAGVLTNDEAEAAIGHPVEVTFDETPDAKIVVPRWRICGAGADTWRFLE